MNTLQPPSNAASDDSVLMKTLAENGTLDGLNVDGNKLLERTKLFLVAQACNELNRVIKMTNMLDDLEQRFMANINDKLAESPQNLQLITAAMEMVCKSLERSNALIVQVLKDEKLSSIVINTTNIITSNGNSATIMDVNSRDAVRNMASSLLARLQHTAPDADIVDVKTGDEDPDESK